MSFTLQSLNQCTPSLSPSKIPPEIWRSIFRFSTKETVERVEHSLEIIARDRERIVSHILECRKVKLALRGVCRAWRELSSEFFYESASVFTLEQLAELAYELETSSATHRVGNGWWIKTLEIQLNLIDSDAFKKGTRDTIRLLQFLPNLCTFVFCNLYSDFLTPHEVLTALGECCGQSLRRLEWNMGAEEQDLTQLLKRTPSLEYLVLSLPPRNKYMFPHPTPRSYPTLALPQLRYLEIDGCFQCVVDLRDWDLPNLTSLTVRLTPQIWVPALMSFLEAHCHKLHSLVLIDRPGLLQSHHWTRLLRQTDQLQNLTVNLGMTQPFCTVHPHRSLTRLGIMGLLPHPDVETDPEQFREHWDDLEDHLVVLEDPNCFPSLKAIRTTVMDAAEFRERLGNWSFDLILSWQKWVDRFKRRGVRLEDRNGEILRPTLSDLDGDSY